MENSELIARLCNEATKTTPDIYKQIIKSAKAQGLLSSGGKGASPAAKNAVTAKPKGTSSGAGGENAVKAVPYNPVKEYIVAAVSIILAAAIGLATLAIPVEYNLDGGLGDSAGTTQPDNTDNNPTNPSTPTTPDAPPSKPEPTPPEEEVIEQPENYTEGFSYELNEDGKSYSLITTTDYGYWDKIDRENPDLIVPAYYNDKPVTEIQGREYTVGLTYFKSITIPKTVKKIGKNAFINFSKLTEINLPEGLIEIGEDAFKNTGYYDGRSNWDDGVLYIGEYLVAAQPSWITVTDGNAKTETLKVPETYKIKEGTKLIADGAFRSADYPNPINIKNITFPEGLVYIGEKAFKHCKQITEIILPDSVKKIGYDAFSQCNGATKLKMSNSIEYIGEGAFRMCAYLAADLDFADSLTYIGADAFCFSNITSVVIPDKTRYIGARAFAACKLQSISLGKGVQYIGEEAFIGYYEGVKSIVIPASVRVIGPNALYSYNQKAELVFEDPEDWTRTPTPHEVEMGEADHGNVSVAWYCEQNGYEGLYNLLCQRYGKPPEDENGDPVPGYENVSFLGTLTVHDIDQMNLPDYIADYYQSYGNSFWLKGFWH